MEAAEEQLWAECRQGGAAARTQLIERYLPLARRLAAALFARRILDDVEFGDYLQLAYVGLLDSVERYHAGGEAQFATFATYRIRGAILNGMAKMTESRSRLSYLKQARRDRAESIAQTSGRDLAALLELVVGIALTFQLEEAAAEQEAVAAPEATNPYASALYHDMQRRVREVLGLLPQRERQIIHYHYFHQIGFDEIGALLGVTKGRVSQLHGQALALVRANLQRQRVAELY